MQPEQNNAVFGSSEQTREEKEKSKRAMKAADVVTQVVKWGLWGFIFLYSLTVIALYSWILLTSFKDSLDFDFSPLGFPEAFVIDNYVLVFKNLSVPRFTGVGQRNVMLPELMLNTAIYITGCSLAATITPCIVAYATAKFRFAFNKVLDGIVIVTMVLPIIGALPSEIAVAQAIGAYGRFIGMFFMKTSFLGANYLFFKSAFRGVADTYAEAARVDGASQMRIMFTIVFPMIKNIFFVILLVQIIGYWGDWQTPMIYLPKYPTVAYAVFNMQFKTENSLNLPTVQMAASIASSIPTLILFVLFRKKIMGGLAFGGLKG